MTLRIWLMIIVKYLWVVPQAAMAATEVEADKEEEKAMIHEHNRGGT